MFNNECLGELGFEATTASIVMAGIFLSFFVEYLGQRFVDWRTKVKQDGASGSTTDQAPPELLSVLVLESGIIFHSLCKLRVFRRLL